MGTALFCRRRVASQMTSAAKFAGVVVQAGLMLLACFEGSSAQTQNPTSAPAKATTEQKPPKAPAAPRAFGSINESPGAPQSRIEVVVLGGHLSWPARVERNKSGKLLYSIDPQKSEGSYTVVVKWPDLPDCPDQKSPSKLKHADGKWAFQPITLRECDAQQPPGRRAEETAPQRANTDSLPNDSVEASNQVVNGEGGNEKPIPPSPQKAAPVVRSLTIAVAASRRPEDLLWVVALFGCVLTLIFQALSFFNRMQGEPDLPREIGIIRGEVQALEVNARSARGQWEKEVATAAASRLEPSHLAQAAVQNQEIVASVQFPRYTSVVLAKTPEPELVVQTPQPVFGRDIVADYETTRSAVDQEKAILQFESVYSYTRLSLVNQKDVEINPNAVAEFESSSRGYFLGVEHNRQMLCFPWFSLDFSQPVFALIFDNRAAGRPLLRTPAILAVRVSSWILQTKGRIES